MSHSSLLLLKDHLSVCGHLVQSNLDLQDGEIAAFLDQHECLNIIITDLFWLSGLFLLNSAFHWSGSDVFPWDKILIS